MKQNPQLAWPPGCSKRATPSRGWVQARERGRGTVRVITTPVLTIHASTPLLPNLIRADRPLHCAKSTAVLHAEERQEHTATPRDRAHVRWTDAADGAASRKTPAPAPQRPAPADARCRHADDKPRRHARPKLIPEKPRRANPVHPPSTWSVSASPRSAARRAQVPKGSRSPARFSIPKNLASPPATCPPAPRARPPRAAARRPCRPPPSLQPS